MNQYKYTAPPVGTKPPEVVRPMNFREPVTVQAIVHPVLMAFMTQNTGTTN